MFFQFVKDKIISSVSYSPNNRTNTYSNLNQILLRNTLEPIPKKVIVVTYLHV
jgi:hypothetical protein